jgi:hypothetical protein
MRFRKLHTSRAWGFSTHGDVKVELPTTLREWELFSSRKGCGKSAQAMTKALNAAITDLERNIRARDSYEEMRDKYVAAFKKHVQPTAYAHSYCGASDTEPWGKAAGKLARAAVILADREDDRDRLVWEV